MIFNDHEQEMAIAGALGGIVRWLTLRTSILDGIISIVVGGICAVFLGPLLIPMIEKFFGEIVIANSSRAGLSGFVIGIGGVGVSGFVLDLLAHRREALLKVIGDGKSADNREDGNGEKQ